MTLTIREAIRVVPDFRERDSGKVRTETEGGKNSGPEFVGKRRKGARRKGDMKIVFQN